MTRHDIRSALLRPSIFGELLTARLDFFVAKVFQHLKPETEYSPGWLVSTMSWHLTEALVGREQRLIINVPPRHLKSICASVAFPAFVLGDDPRRTIILVCYSQELGEKMMRDLRSVMESEWYREHFPKTRLQKKTASELTTTRTGGVNMTSTHGTLTGRGADYIILDDPIKAGDVQSTAERNRTNEWLHNTLFSRLDNKTSGRIIIAMQRLHEDDVTGFLTAPPDHTWTVLKVPAIAVEDQEMPILPIQGRTSFIRARGSVIDEARESVETLDRIRSDIGSLNFAAQYQQDPIAHDGNLVRTDWFGAYDHTDKPERFDAIVASWDTASAAGANNDYSAGTIWGILGNRYYLLQAYRERLTYPALRQRIEDVRNLWNVNLILLENADSGRNLYHDLRGSRRDHIRAIAPRGNKEDRLAASSAVIEEGRVFLPNEASWRRDLLNELTAFPNTRHDDQVDSVSMFLNFMRNKPDGTLQYTDAGCLVRQRRRAKRRRLR